MVGSYVLQLTASAAAASWEGGQGKLFLACTIQDERCRGKASRGQETVRADTVGQGGGAASERHAYTHRGTPSRPALPAPQCSTPQSSCPVLFACFCLLAQKAQGDG